MTKISIMRAGIGMIAAGLMSATLWAQSGEAAGGDVSTASDVEGKPAAVALDPEVDRILTRLERRRVRDLRVKQMTWSLQYQDANDIVVKRGELAYLDEDRGGEEAAKFLVKFVEKTQSKRRQEIDERYAFDGYWYVEAIGATKTISRHEVRRKGDKSNPYKVGEGIFPLPFGQRKEDILAEFDVTRRQGDDKHDRLLLKPKPGTRSAEFYKSLEFWVARDAKLEGLPTRVRAEKLDGTGRVNSTIDVTFEDIELGPGLSPSLFRVETPLGWTEEPPVRLPDPQPSATVEIKGGTTP